MSDLHHKTLDHPSRPSYFVALRTPLKRYTCRDIASGHAPQQLVDAVRDNMDVNEQGATDGELAPPVAIRDVNIREGPLIDRFR